MQLRFRIDSFTSQHPAFPTSNLITKGGAWQSDRFADFPQQLTFAFFGKVCIKNIRIAAHQIKTPSKIFILHQNENNNLGFVKLGVVQFGLPRGRGLCQVKNIQNLQIKATHIRIIIIGIHQSKDNFFGQVGLCSINFIGQNQQQNIVVPQKGLIFGFQSQSALLIQLKKTFIKKQNYQQAKKVKQIQNALKKAGEKLKDIDSSRLKCVKQQDYMGAKAKKIQADSLKLQVSRLTQSFLSSDSSPKNLLHNFSLKLPHIGQKYIQQQYTQEDKLSKSQYQDIDAISDVDDHITYQQRILPAVLNKLKGQSEQNKQLNTTKINSYKVQNQNLQNQFLQKQPQINIQPQNLTPADQANSSILLQYFDIVFIKKLHSKHWQLRSQAVRKSLQDLQSSKQLNKKKLRCYLFIYNTAMKAVNPNSTMICLSLIDQIFASFNNKTDAKDLYNEIQHCLRQTLKKISDPNLKTRAKAQDSVKKIVQSNIVPPSLSYNVLTKTFPQRGASLLKKIRLQNLINLVSKHNIGQGGVPYQINDFVQKAASDPQNQVRRLAQQLYNTIKNTQKPGLNESRAKSIIK